MFPRQQTRNPNVAANHYSQARRTGEHAVEKLLEQLAEAGMSFSGPDQA